jgi:hypothetical protein
MKIMNNPKVLWGAAPKQTDKLQYLCFLQVEKPTVPTIVMHLYLGQSMDIFTEK